MTSHFYRCEVQDGFGPQKLEDDEQALGFTPVWIDVEHALQCNKALFHSDNAPKWLKKEIFVLAYIQQSLLTGFSS